MVDWRQAFDRVDHKILMRILEEYSENNKNSKLKHKLSKKTIRIIEIILTNNWASIDGKKYFEINKGAP
jgi:hypothetical protein